MPDEKPKYFTAEDVHQADIRPIYKYVLLLYHKHDVPPELTRQFVGMSSEHKERLTSIGDMMIRDWEKRVKEEQEKRRKRVEKEQARIEKLRRANKHRRRTPKKRGG